MPERRSFRLLWIGLISLLVLPLLGQECETCPPPANPCQYSIMSVSGDGNECVVRDRDDGATCDDGGVPGICAGGQCVTGECTAEVSSYYGLCDEPLGGGPVGACIDDTCILSQPEDWCVKAGVGRINCCSQQGCSVASGAYCNAPLTGVSCDTTGIEPPDLPGQDGTCVNGACVALSGPCAEVQCRTSYQDQCAREYCDPATSACADYVVQMQPACLMADAPGICHFGTCVPQNDVTCGGTPCSTSSSCKQANCRLPCLFTGTCSPEELADPANYGVCEIDNYPDGTACRGEPGECRGGVCYPLITDCRDFVPPPDQPDATACDDYQECTDDSCCNSIDCIPGFCENTPKPDGTGCAQSQSDEYLGECQNGVCLPDLCRGRVCPEDADPCTEAVCNSPWGSCTQRPLSDGEPCIGEPGLCLNGFCQPILTSECDHEPFDPDREFPECDDGKECTYNRCDFADQCINPRKPNGTPCANGNGSCIFGGCALNGGGGGLGL